jgi:hypothetical protein
LARFGVLLAAAILSIIFGIIGITGSIESYNSMIKRERQWNAMLDERLLQLDEVLNDFVSVCNSDNNSTIIKKSCNNQFNRIWVDFCNRDMDWDKIDSCKRLQSYLIENNWAV